MCPSGDKSGSLYDGKCDTAGTLASTGSTTQTPVQLNSTDVLAGKVGFDSNDLTQAGKTALDSLYANYLAAAQKKSTTSHITLYRSLTLTIRSLDLQIKRSSSLK
ncbi:MAG: hypothetical protein ACOYN2_06405 [Patescibacteria group bacterium]